MPVDVKPDDLQVAETKLFGPHEERAIISMAFDQPEFFTAFLNFLEPEFFEQVDTHWIFNYIKTYQEKHHVVLTRNLCRDIVKADFTADDPHKEVLALIDRESDPRELPIITERLAEWARKKSYARLYSEEVFESHQRGEYEIHEKIIEEARKISNFGTKCHYFFDEVESLFIEENEIKLTTGFKELDGYINEGGPSRKDVFCWMAPTGVGKSIALVNSGAANLKLGKKDRPVNVLHVTLEMSFFKTALRYLGCFSGKAIRNRKLCKEEIKQKLAQIKNTYHGQLIICEFPPDEISVDTVHGVIDTLRKIHGIRIDVVVIDYLELMMSRHKEYNKEDYTRQKRVATELHRLASIEDVLVFTASQTNRSGNENQDSKGVDKVIDINKVAESYGKTMPLSYIVTINQTKDEYESGWLTKPKKEDGGASQTPKQQQERVEKAARENAKNKPDHNEQHKAVTCAKARYYIVKNRNGLKFKSINILINYETMFMQEWDKVGSDIGEPSLPPPVDPVNT